MRHAALRQEARPRLGAPQGALLEPRGCADRARADQDDGHEGEGGQADRRADDHARPARRSPRAPAGDRVPALEGRRPPAVRRGRAAVHRPPGRLLADHQARPAPGRRGRDGVPRAGRRRRRRQDARASTATAAAARGGRRRPRQSPRRSRTSPPRTSEPSRRPSRRGRSRAEAASEPSEEPSRSGACRPKPSPRPTSRRPTRTRRPSSRGRAERGADDDDDRAGERDGRERGREARLKNFERSTASAISSKATTIERRDQRAW